MTPNARVAMAVCACVCGWLAAFSLMRQANPMFQSFIHSKFGRTLIALAAGALAPAVPPLVMGDTHTFRIAVASACGAVVTAIALQFKSEGAS